MQPATSLEPKAPASAETKLAEAVRELIREELQDPQPAEKPQPGVLEVFWVGVVVFNVVLLISQLPEAVLKNTSFEFASKLIGYVFGGILLVYSSWVRERLMALTKVRWFQAAQILLLFVLVFPRLSVYTLKPVIVPADARLLIDDAQVHPKKGEISLNFEPHSIKVAMREGQDKLPNGLPIKQNEFTIKRRDLVFGTYKGTPQWSPLYPLSIGSRDKNSDIEIKTEGRFSENLPDFQGWSTEVPDPQTFRVHMQGHRSLTIYLPLGKYKIFEIRPDKQACSIAPVSVDDKENTASLNDQRCPGDQD